MRSGIYDILDRRCSDREKAMKHETVIVYEIQQPKGMGFRLQMLLVALAPCLVCSFALALAVYVAGH